MSPGIGELNERSLHRALKARYAAPGSATEQAVDGFVADVKVGDRLVEIHTGNFSPLKRKLPRLLAQYPLTLVYPIAQDRYIVKVPDGPGGKTTRRKSPKHGSVYQVFEPLTSIPTLLDHPNMTLDVALVVEDAVRIWDDRARRRRGGWVTVDRRLVDVVETLHVDRMADLFALLDAELPAQFTTRDLADAMEFFTALGSASRVLPARSGRRGDLRQARERLGLPAALRCSHTSMRGVSPRAPRLRALPCEGCPLALPG